MSAAVGQARKKCDVNLPNLYAVPGHHKNADEFNRVQRGHQNMLESMTVFVGMSLVGGLKHPYAVSICGLLYSVGNVLYQKGYADMTTDVEHARHAKGGPIRILGLFGTLVTTISVSGELLGWWN